MRFILWIAIFVSTLAGTSYGYYKFRQSRLIASPAFIEEFRQEALMMGTNVPSAESVPAVNLDLEAECAHLRQIDWTEILSKHTFFHGVHREDIKAETTWTLRLSLLAFVGMEYDVFEIARLDGETLTYHRVEPGEGPAADFQFATQSFEHFRQEFCGLPSVRPLVYVVSELGQVALPLPQEFVNRFMNQAEFRILLGQYINKPLRLDIHQDSWTLDDFIELLKQP